MLCGTLVVLLLLYKCIAIIYEAEDGTYTGSKKDRSAASNEQTVHLDQGEYIQWDISICSERDSILIDNITLTYTNDGSSDTLYLYLDTQYIGQFTTHSVSNYGHQWNIPDDLHLNGPFTLTNPSSSHTLKIVAQSTDVYGVEIDKLELYFASTSINQCYSTINGLSNLNVQNIERNDLFMIIGESVITTCAEEDNIAIHVTANTKYDNMIEVDTMDAYATYAIYFDGFTPNHREANFTRCNISYSNDAPTSTETTTTLFDNGYLLIESVFISDWWLGHSMNVIVNGGNTDMASYWRITQKLAVDVASYQQTFVMYQDGNIRLLPHPPTCFQDWIPFGSSVIIGNTISNIQKNRPYAEISTVNVYPSSNYKYLTADIIFKNGNSMSIALTVGTGYTHMNVNNIKFSNKSGPLVTFRSMYIGEHNNDVDSVRVNDGSINDILELSESNIMEGSIVEFGRKCISKHNTLSPDISFAFSGSIKEKTSNPTANPTQTPTANPTQNPTTNPTIYSSSNPTTFTTSNMISETTMQSSSFAFSTSEMMSTNQQVSNSFDTLDQYTKNATHEEQTKTLLTVVIVLVVVVIFILIVVLLLLWIICNKRQYDRMESNDVNEVTTEMTHTHIGERQKMLGHRVV